MVHGHLRLCGELCFLAASCPDVRTLGAMDAADRCLCATLPDIVGKNGHRSNAVPLPRRGSGVAFSPSGVLKLVTTSCVGMLRRILIWAALSIVGSGALAAADRGRVVGSRVVATAEAPVSRPDARPCSVTLLAHESFDDHGDGSSMAATPHRFHFAPPDGCRGHWRKVVLEADFSVPAGRQFDRTVSLWLGGVNLYFGTTIEPEPGQAQHWHVERDLTDYAAVFGQAQEGHIILNNWISPRTDQPIYADVKLVFYPTDQAMRPMAASADRVYAMSPDPAGAETPLATPARTLSRRFTFPRNVERAYLDVIAQSQSHDERWYTCVDKAYLEKTRAYSLEAFEACDGGSFRGVEVSVDGTPAGLAPVYPWIYTGGVAPHLWLPTPGIQTTDFIPFRVDLTPFAGTFDDGRTHTIAVRVLGADHFFNVAANVLIYQDHHSQRLRGRIVRNTLAAAGDAVPAVHAALHADAAGRVVGTIDTGQTQAYVIVGRLQTARGTIDTTERYRSDFSNRQRFARPGAARYEETIEQSDRVSVSVERRLNGRALDAYTMNQRDPLSLSVSKVMHGTGQDFIAQVAMKQGHHIDVLRTHAGSTPYHAWLDEALSTQDRADGKTIPDPLDRSDFAHHQRGSEQVSFGDALGSCYRTRIASRDERLTLLQQGRGCPGRGNYLDSRSRPGQPMLLPLPE